MAAGYPTLVWANRELILSLTRSIVDATDGFVQPTLLLYLPVLLLVVGGVMLWVGRLRLRDLSLRRGDLRTGVVVTVGVWLLMQVVGIVALLWAGEPIRLNDTWLTGGALAAIGALVAQLFGNALYEEVVFRAFLLNQFRHKLRRRLTTAPRWSVLLALVASQAVFALIHVPSRLVGDGLTLGQLGPTLVLLFVWGTLLAVVYYRTGNLFVTIGIHAFMNAPTMLVGPPDAGVLTAIALGALIAVLWPRIERFTDASRLHDADDSHRQSSN
ncbi:abortive infection protein [Haloferax sulfurifontis ATCC BAA-897]|uniref:Abortive infection protein n=1 Tax=Haloferax sulfurifontis ATCC BAA-897 TaxID=662480 RepID=M0HX86_9EURY|nr:abortive infection protein [Haloferax sulfurifontis ATCC BAA-897]